MSLLYIGHNRSSSITTRKWYDSGTSIWTADHGNNVLAIAVDADGNVYTAGRSATSGWNNVVRKYNSSGTQITDGWPVNIGLANSPTSLAIDDDGSVYVGSVWSSSSSRSARKYASSGGSVVWQVDVGDVYGLAIADDGHIIAVGNTGTDTIRKLNASTGSQIWAVNHGEWVYAVAVDEDGYIYTGGTKNSSNVTTRKWDTDGTEITDGWPADAGDGVSAVYALAVAGGVLVTGGSRDSNITTRAYDTDDGSSLWTADHGTVIQAVAMDGDAVYTGGPVNSTVHIRKYLLDGTAVTTGWPKAAATVNALCLGPAPALAATPPGLPLRWAMAVPQIEIGQSVPGLAILPLALGIPDTTPPAIPPDGRPVQSVYRCYLTGGASLLELPLASFQCRRRVNESTWLVVTLPYYSTALAQSIAARSLGQIVLYAGTRSAQGVETTGEMLRAWLTETEITRESGAATLRLTGRLVPTPFTQQTRTLYGISSRGQTDGRWQIRCAVDFLLRPNDTVTDGAISFIAGAISYQVSAHSSIMTVTEKAV